MIRAGQSPTARRKRKSPMASKRDGDHPGGTLDPQSTRSRWPRVETASDGPSPQRLHFEIRDAAGASRAVTFERTIIKVGKLHSCHLRLEHPDVSPVHAIIEAPPAMPITIIDLGSASGTHVNGHRINKAELQAGDKIQVGGFRITLRVVED